MDLTQFVPMFGNLAFTLLAFVVALSVIVAIHEYGHYIVGRWSGIHADVFSIGFGPVIFSRTDKRGTVWQVAALPIGGYVKFMGDSNAASVGSEAVDPVDARKTMLGAPLWARTVTVAAGPIFNFILAVLIFGGSIMYDGRIIDPVTFGDMRDLPPDYATELQEGDVMLSVAGVPFSENGARVDIIDRVPLEPRLDYTVLRDGQEMVVEGPYPMPAAVSGVTPRSSADDAGVRVGDVITAIDGEPVFAFPQVQEVVAAADGRDLNVTLWRDGETREVTLAPRRMDLPTADGFETRWLLGIRGEFFFSAQTEFIGPWEAVKIGADQLWATLTTSLSALKHIIQGQISTCNLSGPVGIAETSGSMARQGTVDFIFFIGALSAAVGLVNLFPIPVLDGGHLMFYAYEAVTRRKPSDQVIRVFMFMGLGLILSLMSFTILNDTLLCP